jgi:hypothetical protein
MGCPSRELALAPRSSSWPRQASEEAVAWGLGWDLKYGLGMSLLTSAQLAQTRPDT